MENDDDMRTLMEQLLPCFYSSFVPNIVNIVTQDSFVPGGCITKDFFQKIFIVLSAKQLLISEKWKNFVAINCLKMASSHEMYLGYIMYACVIEAGFSDGIFDSLLSASALVIAFNIEMLEKTGVNFCELTVDIFMVFYKNALKEQFCKHGGFERFTEYLRHEYLAWKCYLNENPKDSNVPITNRGCFLKNEKAKSEKDLEYVLYLSDSITYNDIGNSICHSLAKEVLLITKVRLPTLPSSAYLNTVRKQKVVRLEETKGRNTSKSGTTAGVSKSGTTAGTLKFETTAPVLQRCSSSVADSQASIAVEKKANIAWCDSIVRAVINYNNSKSSSLVNANKRIQKADEILEHLKHTIKSLAEVLEDSDEE